MHEWAMAYPYLAFFVMLFGLVVINNLILGIVKSEKKLESDSDTKVQTKDLNESEKLETKD